MRAWLQVLGLGFLNGSRTAAVPALLSRRLGRMDRAALPRAARWLAGARVSRLLRLMMIGELIADKLPGVPARTEPPGLLARGLAGAFTGWVLSGLHRQSRFQGAFIGGLAAQVGAFAGYLWRKRVAERTAVPDYVAALVEDTVVVTGARLLLWLTPRRVPDSPRNGG